MINIGLLVILAFFVLALLRVPIFIALALPATSYAFFVGQSTGFPISNMVRTVDSFVLLAVPIFIFVGALMNHGDITDKIFGFADDVVGHVTGGLAQVNILTSLIFSGISGSALADIGGVGKVLIHTMEDHGYDNDFSAALTSASATIGPLFPPSIPLILYGILADASVLDLLIAGALPALATVGLLMVGTYLIAYRNDFPKNEVRQNIGAIARSFAIAVPALATPIVLIAGMLSGLFGPTEAAAVTVVYILFINLFVYRITNLKYIWSAAIETGRTTSVVLVILAAAGLFEWIISRERIDVMFADALLSISQSPAVVLFLVIVMVLILGLFLDPLGALVIITPVVVPPLVQIGYDPVHMGVVIVYGLMIGLLTPPLGLSVYLSADIAEADPIEVFRSTIPYYGILLTGLFLVAYIPDISLYLLRFT